MLSSLLLIFYINVYRYIKNKVNNNVKNILLNVWLYYLILSFVNPVFFGSIINNLFIVATFLAESNYEKEVKNENIMDSK